MSAPRLPTFRKFYRAILLQSVGRTRRNTKCLSGTGSQVTCSSFDKNRERRLFHLSLFPTQMTPLILPPEICSLICTSPLLSHSDLLALCHVSRSFRAEAERILYTSINLPTPSRRALNSWCTSLIRRPHLGARIQTLSLTMPSQTSLQADDLSRLTHALHLCINLRNLSISDGEPPFLGNAVQAWVLEGHTFTLQKFTNTYFTTTMLRDFLDSQKSLTTLSHRPSSSTHLTVGTRLPRTETLPNLTTLKYQRSHRKRTSAGGLGVLEKRQTTTILFRKPKGRRRTGNVRSSNQLWALGKPKHRAMAGKDPTRNGRGDHRCLRSCADA